MDGLCGWGENPGQTALSTRRRGVRALARECGALGQRGQSRFSQILAEALWTGRKPGQTSLSTRRRGVRAPAEGCGALGQRGQSRFSRI
jgi:hypothetical protein